MNISTTQSSISNSESQEDDLHSLMNNTFWSPLWTRDESSRLQRQHYATEFYYSFFKHRRIHVNKNSDDSINPSSPNQEVLNSTMNNSFNEIKLMEHFNDFTMTVNMEQQMEDIINFTMNDSSNVDKSDADDFNSIMHKTFWSPLWRRDDSRRLQRMNYPTEFYYNLIKRRITRDSGFNDADTHDDVERLESSSD